MKILFFVLISFSAIAQAKEPQFINHCVDKLFNLEWWNYEFKKINNITLPSIINTKIVKVAVIDTGINYDNFIVKSSMLSGYSKKDLDFSEGVNSYTSHGNHIIGTILGLNPSVKILPLNVVGVNETMDVKGHNKAVRSIARAINYAVSQKVDLINISIGHEDPMIEEEIALQYARQKGILVVVSAGNNALDIDLKKNRMYPASYRQSNMIVVGLKQKGINKDADMSNTGFNSVDVFTEGSDILSLSSKNCFTEIETGTSMATAFMTAFISLVKSREEISNEEVRNRIEKAPTQVKFMRSKYGFFDFNKFLSLKK